MTWFVGVDGGGTSTRAVVVDESGTELGRAKGYGAVATETAPSDAATAVLDVVRAAATAAGVEGQASVLWAGLAGAGQEVARRGVERRLAAGGVADHVTVGTDVEAAFQDAFGDDPGILLIAGTGSIAWARHPDGSIRRVGGWGHRLGDEGSGYAIGLGGLRGVMRAADGRTDATSLTEALLHALGVSTPEALVGWMESAAKGDVAACAPLVVAAADSGDAVAEQVVEEAVDALLQHVGAAAAARAGPVLLWGGLIADGGPLRARVREALDSAGYAVDERPVDPARGAARLALGSRP